MYNKKSRFLSASMASRLSKGEQTEGISRFQNKRRSTQTNLNGRHNIQSRLGLPLKSKVSVHSRLNINSRIGTRTKFVGQNVHQPSIKLLKKEILNISTSNSRNKMQKNRNRIQLRNGESSDSVPIRINNGAVVKGLRSDQLMLQKYQSSLHSGRISRSTIQKKPLHSSKSLEIPFKRPGKVSLGIHSGLTVSFSNDIVNKNRYLEAKKSSMRQLDENEMSTDDDEKETRLESDQQAELRASLLRIGTERTKLPKPHRQMLDPQVQKEIAELQGRPSGPVTCGPGAGVKNFKMIPNLTRNSLSQRFTIDKSTTV